MASPSEFGPASQSGTSPETVPLKTTKVEGQLQLTDQTNLLPFRKIVACFLGLSLCVLVSFLDSVVVATALPTISSAFHAGSIVSWVPSAYLLTTTCCQPLYGRFSDIFGRKAALIVAMLIFILGNLLAGFSKTVIQLIVFRGIAGAGGGGIVNLAQIVISDIVSLRDRGKYIGIIGGVISIGYAIGPVIGGVLAQKVGWRWCFWVNLPMSLCTLPIIVLVLPLKPVSGDIRQKILAVDFVGALLVLVGCALVILPIIWGGIMFPWDSPIVLAPLFSGLFVGVLFCFWEWYGARLPLIPMYIFKHTTVTGVYIAMFIFGFIQISTIYYLPQYFQVCLGFNPIRAGVFLIPFLVTTITVTWIAGFIVSHTGRYRNIIYLGFFTLSLGLGLISTITQKSSKVELVIFMLLAGCGAGQTLQTTTIAAQAAVARQDMAVVVAFRNFILSLGSTLTLAVGSTIINNSLRSIMHDLGLSPSLIKIIIDKPSSLSSPATLGISTSVAKTILNQGYRHGFRTVFILNACLAAVAAITSIFMIKHKDLTRGDEEELKLRGAESSRGKASPRLSEKLTSSDDGGPDLDDAVVTTV